MNEKDVEPDKNKGIGIAFFMLSLVFAFVGVFTFAGTLILRIISFALGATFLGISVYLHFKYSGRAK